MYLAFLPSVLTRFLLAIYIDKRYRIPNKPDIGGKFRSTLRAPGQKDSVLVEDRNSLRLDIQVSFCFCFALLFFLCGYDIELISDLSDFSLARPDRHYLRVVVHLASVDCTDRFAYAVAVAEFSYWWSNCRRSTIHQSPTTNRQRPPQTINALQVLIEALSLVLVLHIKRFRYDKESGGL